MAENKKCPVLGMVQMYDMYRIMECIEGECAWWNERKEMCVMALISGLLGLFVE